MATGLKGPPMNGSKLWPVLNTILTGIRYVVIMEGEPVAGGFCRPSAYGYSVPL